MVGRKRKEKPNNQRPTCRESAPKNKTGGSITRAARLNRFSSSLQRLNVRGLQALGAADDFEFDRLAVIQRLVAIRLDRGKMYEYIFPGLTLDEAKAFAGVEPLYCSLFFAHFVILFSLKKLSGAPLTETRVSGFVLQTLRYKKFRRNCDSPPRSSGRLQLLFCVPLSGHKKRPRV